MALGKKKTIRSVYDGWLKANPGKAQLIIAASAAGAILVIFYFVVFSEFGASAEFIYNQF